MKKIVSVLTVSSLLIFQSCSLLNQKLTQEVPVTSSPVGARIIVDGKDTGQAPLMLTLKKNKSHTIRIEKEGYNPTELRVLRKMKARAVFEVLAVPIVAVGTGLAVFLVQLAVTNAEKSYETYNRTFTTTVFISGAAATAAVIADMTSGANHSLSPRELDVTLTKVEGQGPPQVGVIYLDAKHLGDIQWIRIRVAGVRESQHLPERPGG